VFATRVGGLCLNNTVEEFDFIDGSFGVVGGRTDDFQSNVFAGGGIAR